MIEIIVLTMLAVLAMAIIGGVMLYDLREINATRHRLLHPHARRYRHRPLVSIVIHGHADDLKQSLESVAASHYKKLEILVPKSSDARKIVTAFTRHSKRKVLLVDDPAGQASGEIFVIMRGKSAIDKRAITNIALRFNTNTSIDTLLPYRQSPLPETTFQLLRKYGDFLNNLLLKTLSISRQLPGATHAEFASDVVVYGNGIDIFRRFEPPTLQTSVIIKILALCFAISLWAMTFIAPTLVTYFIYMAFALHQPTLLMLCGALFGGWVLFAVWWDDQLGLLAKCGYSLLAPTTVLPFYVLSFVQIGKLILKLFANVRKTEIPRRIGLFVRVKNKLRIVE